MNHAAPKRLLVDDDEPLPASLDDAKLAFERDYLVRILTIAGGSVTRAARIAGRNRTEFYRLLERHALDLAKFKTGRSACGSTAG